MIPVLICPVVSRFDLLEDMLRTIDEPIGRLVIVDNSLTGYELEFALPTVEDIDYIEPLIGLGYPGGINAGISQTPDAEWWMWASNDLTFAPGDLRAIVGRFSDPDTAIHLTGSHRGLRNVYGAMNRAAVERVGLFDEWSFFPIYFDDDDMERRCRLGGVEWQTYDGGMKHVGSATIRSSDHSRLANDRTFAENGRRYVAKWGGLPGSEVFSTPWDLPVPLDYCRVDIAGRAARKW